MRFITILLIIGAITASCPTTQSTRKNPAQNTTQVGNTPQNQTVPNYIINPSLVSTVFLISSPGGGASGSLQLTGFDDKIGPEDVTGEGQPAAKRQKLTSEPETQIKFDVLDWDQTVVAGRVIGGKAKQDFKPVNIVSVTDISKVFDLLKDLPNNKYAVIGNINKVPFEIPENIVRYSDLGNGIFEYGGNFYAYNKFLIENGHVLLKVNKIRIQEVPADPFRVFPIDEIAKQDEYDQIDIDSIFRKAKESYYEPSGISLSPEGDNHNIDFEPIPFFYTRLMKDEVDYEEDEVAYPEISWVLREGKLAIQFPTIGQVQDDILSTYGMGHYVSRSHIDPDYFYDKDNHLRYKIMRAAGDQREQIPLFPRNSGEENTIEINSEILLRIRPGENARQSENPIIKLYAKSILQPDGSRIASHRFVPKKPFTNLVNWLNGRYQIKFPPEFKLDTLGFFPTNLTIKIKRISHYPASDPSQPLPPPIQHIYEQVLAQLAARDQDLLQQEDQQLAIAAQLQKARHNPTVKPTLTPLMQAALAKGLTENDLKSYAFYGFMLIAQIFQEFKLSTLDFNPLPSDEVITNILKRTKELDNQNGAVTLLSAHMLHDLNKDPTLEAQFNYFEGRLMTFAATIKKPEVSAEDLRKALINAACMNNKCRILNIMLEKLPAQMTKIDLDIKYINKDHIVSAWIKAYKKYLALYNKPDGSQANFKTWLVSQNAYTLDYEMIVNPDEELHTYERVKLAEENVNLYFTIYPETDFTPNSDYYGVDQ